MSNEWKFFVPIVLALVALGAIVLRQHQRIVSIERRLEASAAAERRQATPEIKLPLGRVASMDLSPRWQLQKQDVPVTGKSNPDGGDPSQLTPSR